MAHERAVAEAFMMASALVDADERVMSFEEARRMTEEELAELVRTRPELGVKLGRRA